MLAKPFPPISSIPLTIIVNQSTINSRIGWAENTHFLEQFRYTLVASQLLNEHPNPTTCRHQEIPSPAADSAVQPDTVNFSLFGISVTATAAFAIAWATNSLRRTGLEAIGYKKTCLASAILFLFVLGLYCHFRRQWLKYLRSQAIHNASTLVANAQGFDTAASSAITFIQEVELVSRGYRLYVDS